MIEYKLFKSKSQLLMPREITNAMLRSKKWKELFPYLNLRKQTVIHPSAVLEDPENGELNIMRINGLQPKSPTDFFLLWNLRLMSDALVTSGKSLRDEPDTYTYCDRIEEHALISKEEYQQFMMDKRIAVLTRNFNFSTVEHNEIYKSKLCVKYFYPSKCDLTMDDMLEINDSYRITVKQHEDHDPFNQIVSDLKQHDSRLISIECGPTVTGPLYATLKMKGIPVTRNPVDILLLTRYVGKINQTAIGPRFGNIQEIQKTFEKVSSVTEPGKDGNSTWTFEQWNKIPVPESQQN